MKKGIREGEREVGGDGVCGCSFGEPLKQVIKMKWTYKQLYWSNLTCYWFRYIGFTVTDQELLQKKNNI